MAPLKIWLLERLDPEYEFDAFDAIVVVERTAALAKEIRPDGRDNPASWPTDPELIKATCIGTASARLRPRLILGSHYTGE